MNIERLKTQLESYSTLEKSLEKLQTQGFYNLFYTSFQSLHSQDEYFQSFQFKKCLKLILSELIDTI